MSQTVCKQLAITQFSENHYFPMKCWTPAKLGFGIASAVPSMQCSPDAAGRGVGRRGEKGGRKGKRGSGRGRGDKALCYRMESGLTI